MPGWMPTHSSAHLVEKFKKLMETLTSNANLMDCKQDDLKKRTHMAVGKDGVRNLMTNPSANTNLPEIKHLCNGATLPPLAKTQG